MAPGGATVFTWPPSFVPLIRSHLFSFSRAEP